MLNQRINRHRRINYWNTTRFCMELEKAKSHDCPCVDMGCDALRSVHKLPRTLESQRIGSLIRVEDLTGNPIPRKNSSAVRTDMYDPIKRNRPGYYISNQRIILLNAPNRKAVQVQGVWEDPLEWADIHYCGKGDEHPCPDVWEQDSLLDAYLEEHALRNAIELITNAKKMPEDELVNASENIK